LRYSSSEVEIRRSRTRAAPHHVRNRPPAARSCEADLVSARRISDPLEAARFAVRWRPPRGRARRSFRVSAAARPLWNRGSTLPLAARLFCLLYPPHALLTSTSSVLPRSSPSFSCSPLLLRVSIPHSPFLPPRLRILSPENLSHAFFQSVRFHHQIFIKSSPGPRTPSQSLQGPLSARPSPPPLAGLNSF